MTKKMIKKKVIPVPQNQEEFIEFLKELNKAAGRKEAVKARIEEKKAAIEILYAKEIMALEETIDEKAEGVYMYCQTNRKLLTQDNKIKTVAFPGGTVSWRFNRRSVDVKDEETAVTELEQEGLYELVRVKKTVNKDAVLEKPSLIEGLQHLKIKEGDEVFYIKPADVKFELQRGKRKFKVKEI